MGSPEAPFRVAVMLDDESVDRESGVAVTLTVTPENDTWVDA